MKSLVLFLSFLFLLYAPGLQATNFSVSSTANDGPGSLRAAIEAANGDGNTPHTISFDANLNGQTITLSSMIFITNSMTIEGLGVDQLTISGGNSTRIFWIQNGTIEIKDLTLANGIARGGNGANGGMGAGGAIFMHEGSKNGPGSLNLTLTNVHFQNNQAIGGTGKGTFAEGGGGMGGNGGGVQCCGGGGGGVIGNGGDGGDGNGTVITGGGGGSVGNGSNLGPGGPGNDIFGNGGNGSNAGGQTGGFGGGGGGGDGTGGNGGFGGGGGGAFGNGGFGGGGGTGGNGGFGGGGRSPGFGGGAGTSFFEEEGGGMGAGGAIFVTSGLLTLENVSFSGNSALGGNGLDGEDGLGLGGAIFVFDKADNGGNAAPVSGTDPMVTIIDCLATFSGNAAGDDAQTAYFTNGASKNNNDDVYGFITCLLPSTDVSLSNGDLLIEDVNGADSDDLLTLKKNGSDLLICDPNQLLSAGNGVTQVNDNCVSVPLTAITGKILANTLAGKDLLTLDFSMGSFIPAEGIEYLGGDPISGPGDALAIEGANVTNAASNYLNESDGSIELDNSTITYTGLEPISFMGSFVTFDCNFTANSETITFEDAGGGSLFLDSDFAEATTFTPPTMTLSIDGEGGTDILNIQDNLNLSHALNLDVEEVNLNGTAAGALSATGLELSNTTSLNIDLNGSAPGTGYDQYVISGDINLNDAGLQINPSFLPAPGEVFVIIDNTGGTTTGAFAGLPEGSVVLSLGAREYIISYADNDVTIRAEVKVIPTMGQWAFFLFGLSIFTLAVVGLYNLQAHLPQVRRRP